MKTGWLIQIMSKNTLGRPLYNRISLSWCNRNWYPIGWLDGDTLVTFLLVVSVLWSLSDSKPAPPSACSSSSVSSSLLPVSSSEESEDGASVLGRTEFLCMAEGMEREEVRNTKNAKNKWTSNFETNTLLKTHRAAQRKELTLKNRCNSSNSKTYERYSSRKQRVKAT